MTEEAIVPLTDFSLKGGKNAGFRRTLRDMEGVGISFEFMAPPFPGDIMDQLRTVSDAWLGSKGGQEMQFSPCYFSPEYIQRNPVAVARETSGRIIATKINFIPSGSRATWPTPNPGSGHRPWP